MSTTEAAIDVSFKEVERRYKKDPYLHRLAILEHIEELRAKHQRLLAMDKDPFRQEEFMKELADLYILLDMYRDFWISFRARIVQRKHRFAEKLYEMRKKELEENEELIMEVKQDV